MKDNSTWIKSNFFYTNSSTAHLNSFKSSHFDRKTKTDKLKTEFALSCILLQYLKIIIFKNIINDLLIYLEGD